MVYFKATELAEMRFTKNELMIIYKNIIIQKIQRHVFQLGTFYFCIANFLLHKL
jgi:hypothetical protein